MLRARFPMRLLGVMVVLVTIALYWPATRCDFISYDDALYVTSNVHVQNGLTLESLNWAFFNPDAHFGYWHPLTLLSHMVDCQLFGLKPWGHHLTSVLLHAVNALLVFLLLRTLTAAVWRSLLASAVFGLHPLHVESVAWVAERKDVLSACFGLLALLLYVRYAQKVTSSQRHAARGEDHKQSVCVRPLASVHYWLALLFFACGLMSKPMLVTWPFVMLLLDYWPLRRVELSTVWRLVAEKIPFFVLAAVAGAVTFVVSKRGDIVMTVQNLPLGARGGNALISYCRYLGKMFWPTDLAVFYPHPGYWPLEKVLLAGVFILSISVLLIATRRRYPFLLMGWLWFCGTLVPVVGLVQVGEHAMADRYTYIPSFGVLIVAIWGAYEVTRRWRYHVIALSVAGTAALVLCFALTRQQIGYWEDSETLFRHALEVTENNYLAHYSIGRALAAKGRLDEAISFYRKTLQLMPDYAAAHNNFGNALFNKGQIEDAIRQYQGALRLKPDDANAHYNLGIVLSMEGQTERAIRQFQEAIRLKPDDADARNNLRNALLKAGRTNDTMR